MSVAPFSARIPWSNNDHTLTVEAIRWIQRELLAHVGGESDSNSELTARVNALTAEVASLISAQAALTLRVAALESQVEALIAGEIVFQPAPFQELAEMTFQ